MTSRGALSSLLLSSPSLSPLAFITCRERGHRRASHWRRPEQRIQQRVKKERPSHPPNRQNAIEGTSRPSPIIEDFFFLRTLTRDSAPHTPNPTPHSTLRPAPRPSPKMCITHAIYRAQKRKQEKEEAAEAQQVQHKIQAHLGLRPMNPPPVAERPSASSPAPRAPMPCPHSRQRQSPPRVPPSAFPLSPHQMHFASHQGTSEQPAELDSPDSPIHRQSIGPPPARHPGHHAYAGGSGGAEAQTQGGNEASGNAYSPESFELPQLLPDEPPSYSYSEQASGKGRDEPRGYEYGLMAGS